MIIEDKSYIRQTEIWIEKGGDYAYTLHIREKNKDVRTSLFKEDVEQLLKFMNDNPIIGASK